MAMTRLVMATAKWPVDLPADLVEEGLDQPDRGLGVVAGDQMGDEAGQVPHASDWAVVESASRDRAAAWRSSRPCRRAQNTRSRIRRLTLPRRHACAALSALPGGAIRRVLRLTMH